MDTKERIRDSTAHVMAAAIKELWPQTKLGTGPTTEEGFYYDIDCPHQITEEDFKKIEEIMKKIIKENHPFEKKIVSYQDAKKLFTDETYKKEIIEELKKNNEEISYYTTGKFIDLCKGPHIENTKEIKAFKLTKVSGSYWRGKAENPTMQRIYGTAFASKEELKEYLQVIEEAKKRDHRKLGKELNLIIFNDHSPGSPLFLPDGAFMYNTLQEFMREEYKKRGYNEVITPLLYDKELWETSGHWEHYKENMFTLIIDKRDFALKAMNCPSHCLIYKHEMKSYRDLPLRIADFAPLHRNELKGVLSGLTRVRKFSQDDAHIFCTPEQIKSEIHQLMDFINDIYKKIFKMDFTIELSTRPEKYMGNINIWNKAESTLKDVLVKAKVPFTINEGDGAFYGPKIDIHIKDALKRTHQLATIQLDFQLPERFQLEYTDEEGKRKCPVMIHRAILGSLERFIGLLIEQYAGKFPVWLSPTQVIIVTVADRHNSYAKKLAQEMEKEKLRVKIDNRSESISKKIRDNQAKKVPYIITIGDKEIETGQLAIRDRNNTITTKEKKQFIKEIVKERENKD